MTLLPYPVCIPFSMIVEVRTQEIDLPRQSTNRQKVSFFNKSCFGVEFCFLLLPFFELYVQPLNVEVWKAEKFDTTSTWLS